MIVKTGEDVIGTKGEARGDKWRSLRLLHKEDGMGVTLVDALLEPGFDMVLCPLIMVARPRRRIPARLWSHAPKF